MATKYRVVIRGLKPGESANLVAIRLGTLFKLPPEKVVPVLSRPGTPIKAGIDLERAVKYQVALENAGCDCIVEPESSAAPVAMDQGNVSTSRSTATGTVESPSNVEATLRVTPKTRPSTESAQAALLRSVLAEVPSVDVHQFREVDSRNWNKVIRKADSKNGAIIIFYSDAASESDIFRRSVGLVTKAAEECYLAAPELLRINLDTNRKFAQKLLHRLYKVGVNQAGIAISVGGHSYFINDSAFASVESVAEYLRTSINVVGGGLIPPGSLVNKLADIASASSQPAAQPTTIEGPDPANLTELASPNAQDVSPESRVNRAQAIVRIALANLRWQKGAFIFILVIVGIKIVLQVPSMLGGIGGAARSPIAVSVDAGDANLISVKDCELDGVLLYCNVTNNTRDRAYRGLDFGVEVYNKQGVKVSSATLFTTGTLRPGETIRTEILVNAPDVTQVNVGSSR